VRTTCVAVWVRRIAAPAIEPPLESCTVPVIEPSPDWARRATEETSDRQAAASNLESGERDKLSIVEQSYHEKDRFAPKTLALLAEVYRESACKPDRNREVVGCEA
jgi:hypothetical protein